MAPFHVVTRLATDVEPRSRVGTDRSKPGLLDGSLRSAPLRKGRVGQPAKAGQCAAPGVRRGSHQNVPQGEKPLLRPL